MACFGTLQKTILTHLIRINHSGLSLWFMVSASIVGQLPGGM